MCILCLLRISKLAKNQTNAVFDLKLMVGGGEQLVVRFGFALGFSVGAMRASSHHPLDLIGII